MAHLIPLFGGNGRRPGTSLNLGARIRERDDPRHRMAIRPVVPATVAARPQRVERRARARAARRASPKGARAFPDRMLPPPHVVLLAWCPHPDSAANDPLPAGASTSTGSRSGRCATSSRAPARPLNIPYGRGTGIVFHDTRHSAVTNLV